MRACAWRSAQVRARDEVKNFPATPRFARLCTEAEKLDALAALRAPSLSPAVEANAAPSGGTDGAASRPRRKKPAGGGGGCCGAKPQERD
eukprot:COSAG02_NODE_1105_length_14545_cov_15.280701_2_plen_90_part_00